MHCQLPGMTTQPPVLHWDSQPANTSTGSLQAVPARYRGFELTHVCVAGVLQGRGTAAAQSCLLATSRLKAAVAAAACPQPYELPDLLSSACAGAALESLDGQQSSGPAGSATAAAALLTPRHIALSSSGVVILSCPGWLPSGWVGTQAAARAPLADAC